jgi:glycosyltransferase involved in cell wall biosynthesis
MSLQVSLSVLKRRALENPLLVNTALLGFVARGGFEAARGRRHEAVTALAQVHRTTRLEAMRRAVEPYIVANRDVSYRAPDLTGREPVSSYFGTRISVLKEPGPNGERGVLFVMFSELLSLVWGSMDIERLVRDYTIVSEPTWAGFCDEDLLRFTQLDEDVFVLAKPQGDLEFLQRLSSNLVPVDLGCCDWVDPRIAEPHLGNPKEFDLVMNSHWGHSKRHHVLFRMLRQAKRKYRVLLIGGSWEGRTIADARALARHYGVEDQLTFHERLPFDAVMDLTCRARVSILLSLKEGSNRAIAESIFCNLPVIVLANHVGGIVKNVVPETGLLVHERELESAVERLLAANLQPRAWGVANISCHASSARLNAILRERALARGRPWTRDIATRSNSPESRYVDPADAARLAPWNARLRDYLRT